MKLLILLLVFPACVMAQNNILPPLGLPKPVSIDSPSPNSEPPVSSSININYHITRFTGEDKLIEQNYETKVIPKQSFETKQTEDFTIRQTLLPVENKYFLNYNLQYDVVETSGSLLVEKKKSFIIYRQKGLKIITEIK